ncbi:MAG TPA: EthD family reductase [Candidatus Sulfotelmatobacter sp.]|jgi:uncharacterized protein (TIGR02118 family)|nr:EthD family reductase [Candidatus Sulfotelmatobacter sp.]
MIKVCILYPAQAGNRFDKDYYLKTHMPMAAAKLGPALRGASVDFGVNGGLPEQPAPFFAVCNLLFDDVESFYTAFAPHMEALQGDVPNYTDVAPIFQISDVVTVL